MTAARAATVASGPHDRVRRIVHASFAACALAACLPAGAQVEATSDYLARMDTDGDGRVSQAEYVAWMGYAFDRMDRDRDGVLTPDELPGGRGHSIARAAHDARSAATFRKQDANRDGFLSARELASPPQ